MKPQLTYVLAVLFLVTYSLSGCKDTTSVSAGIDPDLIACWTHSGEETDPQGVMYRKCDYQTNWPPSHFRNRFTLRENMSAEYLVMHPADAHFLTEGTWTFNQPDNTFTIMDSKGQSVSTYKIIHVQTDKLILQPGN